MKVAIKLKPQVIVVDIGLPLLNGLDAGERLKRLLPQVKLIYLTMHTEIEMAVESFRRGASAYLSKNCATGELVVAVRKVLRGFSYFSPSIYTEEFEFLLHQKKRRGEDGERLTGRQREVLGLLAEGMSMKEIGTVLNIETRTVAFHKYRMMEVLRLKSNADLVQVRYA